MLTASGQAANFFAVFNICEAGGHIIASSSIYGGTFNLFGVTMKKMGIECTFVDQDLPEEELAKYFKPNTKAVFGETIANPALDVLDIEKFAEFLRSLDKDENVSPISKINDEIHLSTACTWDNLDWKLRPLFEKAVADGVYRIEYKNGCVIWVNYMNSEYISEDGAVAPKGYLVKGGA